MHEEGGGDRWLIGDLRRDRSPLPRVDRLLAGVDTPLPRDELEARLERLELRIDELERRLRAPSSRTSIPVAGYTLFIVGEHGYEIVDRDGIAPAVGAAVKLAGRTFLVERVRRSPFPSDARPCLVLSDVGETANVPTGVVLVVPPDEPS